jgi:hypothetical protein
MKASELRLGNYICNEDYIVIVESIDKDGCIVNFISDNVQGFTNNKGIEPIPLTEEWLIKFGFEYEQDEKAFCITNELGVKYGVCKFENNWSLILYALDDWQVATHIKYVHELQNLYFALNDEELTMK